MFKSIIWATDGSQAADAAKPYVKSLALEHKSEVVVLHVDQLLMGRGGGMPVIADEEDVLAKLAQQATELREDGVVAAERLVQVTVGEGPAETIAATAKQLHSDLIVVGTRGHSKLGGLLVGSITTRLLHIAPCPVFVVPSSSGTASSGNEAATAQAMG
jgi:nucleotide-binding universal stress UspA family protein